MNCDCLFVHIHFPLIILPLFPLLVGRRSCHNAVGCFQHLLADQIVNIPTWGSLELWSLDKPQDFELLLSLQNGVKSPLGRHTQFGRQPERTLCHSAIPQWGKPHFLPHTDVSHWLTGTEFAAAILGRKTLPLILPLAFL